MPSFPEKSLPCQKMYLGVRVPGSLKREQAGYVSDFAGNTSALEVEMLPRRSCVLASFFSLTENNHHRQLEWRKDEFDPYFDTFQFKLAVLSLDH